MPESLLPQTTHRKRSHIQAPGYVHDAAVQAWLNQHFFVDRGYPIPVVFSTPMDAFAEYTRLWKDVQNNPFKYLLNLRDEEGRAVYEQYPGNVRYPLIAVKRGRMRPAFTRSFSLHQNRRVGYLSVSKDIVRDDLSMVAQAQYASAWDFDYQIDFLSARPDTMHIIASDLMRVFHLVTGSVSCRIPVSYPGAFGDGQKACWMYLNGDVETVVSDQTEQKPVEYRVSVQVTIQGYNPDLDVTLVPALWFLEVQTSAPLALGALQTLYPDCLPAVTTDLRENSEGANVTFEALQNLPPITRD